MALWVLKGGRQGEREAKMLSENILAMGWEGLPNLGTIKTKEEIQKLIEEDQPDSSKASVANQTGQLWTFIKKAKIGDLVVVPLKTTSSIAIGKITGDYNYTQKYGANMLHTRSVEWLNKDIPRSSFEQDLLYTFGAFMTFCEAKRNNAEQRVKNILSGKLDVQKTEDISTESEDSDLEILAKDQIISLINQKFKGHALADLVASILRAQGFKTQVSPPGPDGGVDILASSGTFGFGEPRICVQVKSGDGRLDAQTYRELRGVMEALKASHGILISWGGFKDNVKSEAKNDRFKIKLLDKGDLIEELLNNYEKIDSETKSKLVLKKIWVLSGTEKEIG